MRDHQGKSNTENKDKDLRDGAAASNTLERLPVEEA